MKTCVNHFRCTPMKVMIKALRSRGFRQVRGTRAFRRLRRGILIKFRMRGPVLDAFCDDIGERRKFRWPLYWDHCSSDLRSVPEIDDWIEFAQTR